MAVALKIYDQTNAQEREAAVTLHIASEKIVVRDLIERRVKQEVESFNSKKPELFRGLVQPTDTEKTLNGYRFKKSKVLDWRRQADAAIEAFENGQIYLLVDDRQLDSLTDEFAITGNTKVIFLKLVPLIGG